MNFIHFSPFVFAAIVFSALGGCFFALVWLLRRADRLPQDHPNARSLHSKSMPRIGGIGILAGISVAIVLSYLLALLPAALLPLMLAAFALAVLSLLDDYLDLPAWARFLTHLAVIALFLAMMWEGAVFLFFVALLALTWMTNLFNFMDGSDGLAGGMSVMGFAAYAGLAAGQGDFSLLIFCASISAAALAFLRFNFPPARLFMGDAGSVPLGFLAGAVGWLGWQNGVWHWAAPLLIFSPFIVDATVTLLRRGWAGEKVWQAHRSHYYQRLVRMGWSHRRLALTEYGVMLATAASAAWLAYHPEAWPSLLLAWGVFYGIIMRLIDRQWQQFIVQGLR